MNHQNLSKLKKQYWGTCKSIASMALAFTGSGPFLDYVKEIITRDVTHGEKVRIFVREQVEDSSWINSPKHRSLIVPEFTRSRITDPVLAMEKDVHIEATKLLDQYIPSTYGLRFVNGRVVLGFELFESFGDEPVQYRSRGTAEIALGLFEEEYRKAKLPVPLLEIVAYDFQGKEISNPLEITTHEK